MTDRTDIRAALSGETPLARRRRAAEARFRALGLAAIAVSLLMLAIMLASIVARGASAFRQAELTFDLFIDPAIVDPEGNRDPVELADVTTMRYGKLLEPGFAAELARLGIDTGDLDEDGLADMLSREGPATVRAMVLADPGLIGQTISVSVLASGRIDGYLKGRVTRETAALDGNISPAHLDLADRLTEAGMLRLVFNRWFFTLPDASDQRPEAAGLAVALIGSAYMMVLVALFSLPVGVAASIYLEEFAPRNRLTDLIEVNISNLAAVPSIVFGILGLAAFINFAHLDQSSPLVGALVLSLMTLPTIIIATRAAIRAVPPSIRDAALGVGASRMQMVFDHVLPLALPGILTGAILGLARALGETAPLLLIGMVAFVDDLPGLPPAGVTDPATALPVQVYSWIQRSDPAFAERAFAAIIVLLVFLMSMNALAILLRRRFERRW